MSRPRSRPSAIEPDDNAWTRRSSCSCASWAVIRFRSRAATTGEGTGFIGGEEEDREPDHGLADRDDLIRRESELVAAVRAVARNAMGRVVWLTKPWFRWR